MKSKIFTYPILIFSLLFITSSLHAAEISQARALEIKGSASFQKAGSSQWMPLSKEDVLNENDVLQTGEASEVLLELTGNAKTAEVTVRENTQMTLDTFRYQPEQNLDTTLLDVAKGSILIKAEKLQGDSTFEVKTPTTVAGIRGTIFEVNVD